MMDLVRYHPGLYLIVAAALAHVEVPTNVTLRCRNLHNTLEWSYPQFVPGLRFKVDVRPYSGQASVLWVDPPDLQADVSAFSDPTNEYFLTVAAVIGQNESDSAPAEGIIFSYFKDSLARQKCSVDLPSVNITGLEDGHVLFRFTHPWLWHHQKFPTNPNAKRKKKSYNAQLPEFKYDVMIVSQKNQSHDYKCVETVCEETLGVDPKQKTHCLNFTGEMQKIAVKSTQLYCAMPVQGVAPENNNYIYVVIGALTISTLAFVLFLLYQKKTRPSTATPKSMNISKNLQGTAGIIREETTVPQLEPSSPTPLLLNPEESEFTTAFPPADPDLRLPIRVSTTKEDVSDVVEIGHPDEEGHGYMKGSNLDEDESLYSGEAPSGYEKRQVLLELGPDELAEGYRGS